MHRAQLLLFSSLLSCLSLSGMACGGHSSDPRDTSFAGASLSSAGASSESGSGGSSGEDAREATAGSCAACDGGACVNDVCCDRATVSSYLGDRPCAHQGDICGPTIGCAGDSCGCYPNAAGDLVWACGPGLCAK